MTQAVLKRPISVDIVYNIVASIKPFDALEAEHITDTLSWIDSGVPIFRIQKPDVPNKHLVSYFILLDEGERKILLVDHKSALPIHKLPVGIAIANNEFSKSQLM